MRHLLTLILFLVFTACNKVVEIKDHPKIKETFTQADIQTLESIEKFYFGNICEKTTITYQECFENYSKMSVPILSNDPSEDIPRLNAEESYEFISSLTDREFQLIWKHGSVGSFKTNDSIELIFLDFDSKLFKLITEKSSKNSTGLEHCIKELKESGLGDPRECFVYTLSYPDKYDLDDPTDRLIIASIYLSSSYNDFKEKTATNNR